MSQFICDRTFGNLLNSPQFGHQARFETSPIGVLIRLVPEAHVLLRGVDGGADVFAPPSLTDQPGLVEESDCALGIDFAHDVNPPRTQRQALLGNQLRQRRGQRRWMKSTPHLRYRLALQRRRTILVPVPAQEERQLAAHFGATAELVARPEACYPETGKRLDLVIALGFVNRRKAWLDLAVQTATHYLSEHTLMSWPAIEGALVVELMDKGTAQLPPTAQQMCARRHAGFVQMLCQADGVRVKIEGVKILDRRPPRTNVW